MTLRKTILITSLGLIFSASAAPAAVEVSGFGENASAKAQADGSVNEPSYQDFRFTAKHSTFEAGTLQILSDGTVWFSNGRLRGEGKGQGDILIHSGKLPSPDALGRLLAQKTCPSGIPAASTDDRLDFTFDGVRFEAPADGLNVGMDLGREGISIDTVHLRADAPRDVDCLRLTAAKADGVTVSDASGAQGVIDALRLDGAEKDGSISGKVGASGVHLRARHDEQLAAIETLALSWDFPEAVLGNPDLQGFSRDGVLQDLVARGGSFTLYLNGIDLPEHSVAGDVALQAALRNGEIDMSVHGDLTGLGQFDTVLDMDVDMGSSASSGLLGNVPGGWLLPHLRLVSFDLDARDDGAMALAESISGKTRGEVISRLKMQASPAPKAIREPAINWLENAFATGMAQIAMQPERPVSLMELAMAAVMNPESVGTMLGITKTQ